MGWLDSETTTKPWMPKYVKKFQKNIMTKANDYFNSDDSKNTAWTLPGYAGFSDDTMKAFGGLETLAGANSGGAGMSGHLQDIMNNGGFTARQGRVTAGMEDLANNQGLDDIINGDGMTDAQRGAFESLQDTVGGNNARFQRTFDAGGLTDDQNLVADRYRTGMDEAWGTDPAYNAVREQALKEQQMALEANAAKGGRYGGASSQSILAREQGNLGARMDVNELDKWRARTDADAAALAALSQTGETNRLNINSAQIGGLGAVSDAAQRGVDNRNTAIGLKSGIQGQIFNAENAAIDNMSRAYDTAQKPYLTMRAVGQDREIQDQKRINDEMRIHAEQDPFARYAKFLGLATGTPTGSTQTTDPSILQMLTGGGLGVLALGGMMNGWGSGGAPAGSSGWG